MKHADKIACCFFPTTVPFVDDEKEFLQRTAFTTQVDNAYSVFQLRPEEALKTVNVEHSPIDPATEVYNDQRHQRVSVVVVDYQMPDLNGLQFCAQIGKRSVRRILVSAELPIEKAVVAINKGDLHGYIEKKKGDPFQQITDLMRQLPMEFFCEETGTFAQAGAKAQSALDERKFVQHFSQLQQELHIAEYYMLNPAGTFLLLGKNKEGYGLCVRSRAQLQELAKQAQAKGAPKYITMGLANAECLLCLPDPANQTLTESVAWDRCVYPISHYFVGRRGAYYMTCQPGMLDLTFSRIRS
ncbi:MAG: response regulator, partial [Myxococcota bacterium]